MRMTALIAILVGSHLMAATTTEGMYRNVPSLGVQAGLNFETASAPTDISRGGYTGFTVGINTEVPLSDNVALQPELNYSRRGLNLVDVGGFQTDVLYHSIEVPVFGKLSFGEDVRFTLFAGPMGVWNVSNEVRTSDGDSTASTSFNPRTFDVAAVGGAGIEVGAFFANARYALGIIDIDDSSAEWRSRGFKLLAGVRI